MQGNNLLHRVRFRYRMHNYSLQPNQAASGCMEWIPLTVVHPVTLAMKWDQPLQSNPIYV